MGTRWFTAAIVVALMAAAAAVVVEGRDKEYKNAYATMMYMGTPRDYEFYVATRVLMKSLINLDVQADLVVLASHDVPLHWIRSMELEDGIKVLKVRNLHNPYKVNWPHDRFKLTLNKLHVWTLTNYERVVMLDADNLFLQNTDELFHCGEFCAVFINPCIFHTGLFVIQPSMEVFNGMIHDLEVEKPVVDGADQGFIGSYFPDLLDKPMFHPPANNSVLSGQFRLPLGYQMDASYYYLKLRWNIPCGPNSVITFPGAVWLKPWYWWSWPVLPLGFSWHERRLNTIGYGAEMPMVIMEAILFVGIIAITQSARPSVSKLCYRRIDKSFMLYQACIKLLALASIIVAYALPFFLIPKTIHPIIGWTLYLLGSFSFCSIAINAFLLPTIAVITPGLGILGALVMMAYPWYKDGVVRALAVFTYAFCVSPLLLLAYNKVMVALQASLEREGFLPSKLSDSPPPLGLNKIW